jgi:hypothetical protein
MDDNEQKKCLLQTKEGQRIEKGLTKGRWKCCGAWGIFTCPLCTLCLSFVPPLSVKDTLSAHCRPFHHMQTTCIQGTWLSSALVFAPGVRTRKVWTIFSATACWKFKVEIVGSEHKLTSTICSELRLRCIDCWVEVTGLFAVTAAPSTWWCKHWECYSGRNYIPCEGCHFNANST